MTLERLTAPDIASFDETENAVIMTCEDSHHVH